MVKDSTCSCSMLEKKQSIGRYHHNVPQSRTTTQQNQKMLIKSVSKIGKKS